MGGPIGAVRSHSGTKSMPFPRADSLQNAPPESVAFRTDLDLAEMVAPLLEKLPVVNIKPAPKADEAVDFHPKRPAVNNFVVGRKSLDKRPPPGKQAIRQKARRTKQLIRKMVSGQKHVSTYIVSPAAFKSFPTTRTGWAGRDVRYKTDQAWLQEGWCDCTLLQDMITGGFKFIAFDGMPTWLVDRNGFVFGYRTDIPEWMQKIVVVDGHTMTLLSKIAAECKDYMEACGDISDKVSGKNRRGPHWFHVSGVDRQISFRPKFTSFHMQHEEITDALMSGCLNGSDKALRLLVLWASRTFELHFPHLAARVWRCRDSLLAMGVEPDIAIPQYGCWYNFCINGPRGDVKGVFTKPHADAKNLALMMCAVFVYGEFNSKEKAWLVLWEAGLVIEVPPGALIYYPSALFTHFNVNLTDLKFVTTSDGSVPTPETSSPLEGVDGRGSIVLFNQASLFQYAELKGTVAETKRQGLSASCDNEEHIQRLPVVDLY